MARIVPHDRLVLLLSHLGLAQIKWADPHPTLGLLVVLGILVVARAHRELALNGEIIEHDVWTRCSVRGLFRFPVDGRCRGWHWQLARQRLGRGIGDTGRRATSATRRGIDFSLHFMTVSCFIAKAAPRRRSRPQRHSSAAIGLLRGERGDLLDVQGLLIKPDLGDLATKIGRIGEVGAA